MRNLLHIYNPYDDPINANPDKVNSNGTKIWMNSAGEFHRGGDLPALIMKHGCVYMNHGVIHRSGDKPAIVYCVESNGETIAYYRNGEIHRDRELGPAMIYPPSLTELDTYKHGKVEYYNKGERMKTAGMLPGEYDELWLEAVQSLIPKKTEPCSSADIYRHLEI